MGKSVASLGLWLDAENPGRTEKEKTEVAERSDQSRRALKALLGWEALGRETCLFINHFLRKSVYLSSQDRVVTHMQGLE